MYRKQNSKRVLRIYLQRYLVRVGKYKKKFILFCCIYMMTQSKPFVISNVFHTKVICFSLVWGIRFDLNIILWWSYECNSLWLIFCLIKGRNIVIKQYRWLVDSLENLVQLIKLVTVYLKTYRQQWLIFLFFERTNTNCNLPEWSRLELHLIFRNVLNNLCPTKFRM